MATRLKDFNSQARDDANHEICAGYASTVPSDPIASSLKDSNSQELANTSDLDQSVAGHSSPTFFDANDMPSTSNDPFYASVKDFNPQELANAR
eukprot:12406345-Karenia_brevis.AAC.1